MTYWVEYSKYKGIRENLMTDSIEEARKKAYRVISKGGDAKIFKSRHAQKSEGVLYYLGGYYGTVFWISHTGKVYHAYYVKSNGKLNGRAKE